MITIRNLINRFENEVASLIDIPQSKVKIVGLTAGSVIVNWVLVVDDVQTTIGRVDQILTNGRMYTGRTPLLADNFVVTPQTCDHRYVPLFHRFQISVGEFDSRWNRDYAVAGNVPRGENRGGRPFDAPEGWFRHALNCGRFGADRV
jgi:hypothetical protein